MTTTVTVCVCAYINKGIHMPNRQKFIGNAEALKSGVHKDVRVQVPLRGPPSGWIMLDD